MLNMYLNIFIKKNKTKKNKIKQEKSIVKTFFLNVTFTSNLFERPHKVILKSKC